MARINTYQVDNDISANDIVIGSEYNGVTSTGIPIYKTKNYRLSDLQLFFGGGNFEFAAPITIQTTSAGNKKWIHDNIDRTSNTSSNVLVHSGTFTAINSIVTDAKGHITLTNLATYTLPDYKFNIAADSNPGSDDAVIDINSSSFDTLNVLGGVVLTSKITADDTITVDHDNITRSDSATLTPSTLTYGTANTGKFTAVTTVTTTLQGHVTDVQSTQFTLPEIYTFDVKGDNTGANQTIANGNTLIIAGTAPISTLSSDTDTVTITHDDASTLNVTNITSITNTTFGGTFTVMGSVGRDTKGHLTSARPVNVTIPNTLFTGPSGDPLINGTIGLVPAPGATDGSKFLRGDATWAEVVQTSIATTDGTFIDLTPNSATSGSVTVTADLSATGTTSNATFLRGDNQWATPPGTYSFDINADATVSNDPVFNKEITSGQTLNILGGTNLGSTVSANDTVTINHDTFSTTTSTHAQSPGSPGFGGNFTVLSDVAVSNGHVTDKETIQINMPSLPTYDGDDISIDTSGADVIDTLVVTTNTLGHVTDASATKRTLTLADLGYTGATDANNYTFPYTISQAAGNSTVVRRHDSGYIFANYFNTTPDTVTSGVTQVCVETGNDGYIRHGTAAAVRSFINVADGANNITNNNQISNGRGFITGYTEVDTLASITGRTNGKFTTNDIHVGGASSALTNARFSVHGSGWSSFSCNSATKATPQSAGIHLGWNYSNGSQESEIKFGGLYSHTHKKLDIISLGVNNAETTVMRLQTSGISCGVSGSYINITASNFTVSSDIRLKSNIKPIKDGINVLKQFTSYEYIKDDKKEAGFIAQEVKKAIPYSVVEDEENYLTMNDRAVLAHMHKAILELEERLTAIEEKLN